MTYCYAYQAQLPPLRWAKPFAPFMLVAIGTDSQSDIALVKADASGLPAVKLGSTTPVKHGAGILPNRPGTVGGWITSSQHLKPGNLMPEFRQFTGAELHALVAYLGSLE